MNITPLTVVNRSGTSLQAGRATHIQVKAYHIPFIGLFHLLIACSGDDDAGEMPPENNPPGDFGLIEVADGATAVGLQPAFTWGTAVDPDGDAVTYDLLLDTKTAPSVLLGADINSTSFEPKDRLYLNTAYYWKVIAKDHKGMITNSKTYSFTTRHLNIVGIPAVNSTHFDTRYGHGLAAFAGKLWLIGGFRGTDTPPWSLTIKYGSSAGFSREIPSLMTYGIAAMERTGRRPRHQPLFRQGVPMPL